MCAAALIPDVEGLPTLAAVRPPPPRARFWVPSPAPGGFGVVLFGVPGSGLRSVRRVVVSFSDAVSAEEFALERGWRHFAIAPAAVISPSP